MKKMKKLPILEKLLSFFFLAVKLLGIHMLIFFVLAVLWFFKFAKEDDLTADARYALRQTGLSGSWPLSSSALCFDQYGRDGHTLRIFKVSSAESFFSLLCQTPGWHIAAIDANAYTELAKYCFFSPAELLSPAPDTVFDAWFYRDDYYARYGEYESFMSTYHNLPDVFQLNGQMRTLNATFAFWDKETGLFFYYEYDS